MALRGNSGTAMIRFGTLNLASRFWSCGNHAALIKLRMAGLEHHNRCHPFSHIRMGNADDRRFHHLRQSVDLQFNFLGVHVEPAADDQILAAAGNRQIPLPVK